MRRPDWFPAYESLLGCKRATWGNAHRHEAALVPQAHLLDEGVTAIRAIMPIVEIALAVYAAAYSIRFALVPITTVSSDSLSMVSALCAIGLVWHGLNTCFYGGARNLYIELFIGEFRWRRWETLAEAEVLAVLTPEILETRRRERNDIMDLDGGIWLNATYLKVSFNHPEEGVARATGYLRCGRSLARVVKLGTRFPVAYQKSRLAKGRYRVRYVRNIL